MTFWTKFTQKGYFSLKTEKVSNTIRFCIFELVEVPNFSLVAILNLMTKFAQKSYFRSKTEKLDFRVRPCSLLNYIKLSRTGADRHNGVLMSLLLLVAETIIVILRAELKASVLPPLLGNNKGTHIHKV